MTLSHRRQLIGMLFILPAVMVLGLTILYPLCYTVYLSLFRRSLVDPGATRFLWFGNYLKLATSASFRGAAWNSILVTTGSVILTTICGMAIALLLNTEFPARMIIRGSFILPWAMPTFAAAFAWSWLLDYDFGIVNQALRGIGLGRLAAPWLADPSTALSVVMLIYVWKSNPWTIMVLLAGLQMIPSELREAARVDGASGWQEFRHVILPGMRHIILIAVVLNSIWNFNWFDMMYLLTGGGPAGKTAVLPIEIYDTAFRSFDLGVSSAIGVAMLILLLAASSVLIRSLAEAEEGL